MNDSFKTAIDSFVTDSLTVLEDVIQDTAVSLSNETVSRSPVDTGRFRANWQFSANGMSGHSLNSFDKEGDGAKTKSELAKQIKTFNIGDIGYIYNYVIYGKDLEEGHSWRQAPLGMVRVTAVNFQDYVNDAVIKYKK